MCGAYMVSKVNNVMRASLATDKSLSERMSNAVSSLDSSIKNDTGVLSAKFLPKASSNLPIVSCVLRRKLLAALLSDWASLTASVAAVKDCCANVSACSRV